MYEKSRLTRCVIFTVMNELAALRGHSYHGCKLVLQLILLIYVQALCRLHVLTADTGLLHIADVENMRESPVSSVYEHGAKIKLGHKAGSPIPALAMSIL